MRLVLLGPPGAGKGTQAVELARVFGVPRVATGDLFREHVSKDTALGREARSYMDRGDLVPDEVVIRMVEDRLGRDDARAGFLLDGFPRTVPQALALERLLERGGTPLDVVLRFLISEDEVVGRIVNRRVCPSCGAVYHSAHAPPKVEGVCDRCGAELTHRSDDTPEVVRRRLDEYRAKTEALESFYAERGLLRDVQAVGPVSEVSRRAMAAIDGRGRRAEAEEQA